MSKNETKKFGIQRIFFLLILTAILAFFLYSIIVTGLGNRRTSFFKDSTNQFSPAATYRTYLGAEAKNKEHARTEFLRSYAAFHNFNIQTKAYFTTKFTEKPGNEVKDLELMFFAVQNRKTNALGFLLFIENGKDGKTDLVDPSQQDYTEIPSYITNSKVLFKLDIVFNANSKEAGKPNSDNTGVNLFPQYPTIVETADKEKPFEIERLFIQTINAKIKDSKIAEYGHKQTVVEFAKTGLKLEGNQEVIHTQANAVESINKYKENKTYAEFKQYNLNLYNGKIIWQTVLTSLVGLGIIYLVVFHKFVVEIIKDRKSRHQFTKQPASQEAEYMESSASVSEELVSENSEPEQKDESLPDSK